ncbi:DUF3560 domain-containing protein [Streptomyces smyrnaeus]|uniref:DUF3560 domain-containing protein n=2 Tax=Streptomyces smyrnaeus TaxID=1387713 RepID=A0ABS3Y644_9ACTN|nr:DUF3560 domain-containing protein [Streptomyces smyrnaeus]
MASMPPPRRDTPEQRYADKLQNRAEALAKQADEQSERASGMYGRFAGGQPLLVGHHSYRSALRDRDRADNATRRAIELRGQAREAQWKADKAQAKADITARTVERTGPWQPSDFQPGDVVQARTFETQVDTFRVKRVNKKTLTMWGPGGGWDDPKRTYDRVLSRTRDGVTLTEPERNADERDQTDG